MCPRSRQLKLSFNKSGQNSFSAPEKGASAAQAANEKQRPRHGYDHFGVPFDPRAPQRWTCKAVRRAPRLLAPVRGAGVQSLPAGTALHARPGPGLARQAPLPPELIPRISQAALQLLLLTRFLHANRYPLRLKTL